ncbi:Lrp/AsnC family transcriptional regulator [Lentzea sp. BCCO 10_0856]|uniref:Lrp/AsnC family transcriptional regulator n=1 Tax=Lentzea miocenica TaxID=3095431 RepID=A0ABU4TCR1_9PSEU|nr:Lrp/AsnC family transcriptional regulator [Lentzea sp. BCCO 10_0856]MDX8035943.1 Lrp/AsnC family transcriptional regulator [Lentzea sp. BCCO 10_0856]
MESIDQRLIHALQIDGRAPFAKIAGALRISEHTAARRYHRLRERGIRVRGALNRFRLGHHAWTLRLRCTPDAGPTLAQALARRPDTFWVHLMSGGTEISCLQQVESPDELLLDRLPRRLVDVSAHNILQGFASPGTWRGIACLTDDEATALKPEVAPEPPTGLTDLDEALLVTLALDGRAGYAELATRAGTSESTARRRVEHLRRTGVLELQLDADPAQLGFPTQARLWMRVQPQHLEAAGAALATHPEVYFAAATTGPANLVASVTCRSGGDLYRYLTERVGGLAGVRELETAPVLRTLKRVENIGE